MASFIVVSKNDNKVGEYYFVRFKNFAPKFESSIWRGQYRIFKNKKTAENVKKRIDGYYHNMPYIKTEVEELK